MGTVEASTTSTVRTNASPEPAILPELTLPSIIVNANRSLIDGSYGPDWHLIPDFGFRVLARHLSLVGDWIYTGHGIQMNSEDLKRLTR